MTRRQIIRKAAWLQREYGFNSTMLWYDLASPYERSFFPCGQPEFYRALQEEIES